MALRVGSPLDLGPLTLPSTARSAKLQSSNDRTSVDRWTVGSSPRYDHYHD